MNLIHKIGSLKQQHNPNPFCTLIICTASGTVQIYESTKWVEMWFERWNSLTKVFKACECYFVKYLAFFPKISTISVTTKSLMPQHLLTPIVLMSFICLYHELQPLTF